jgi:hypothetical protein
MRRVSPIAYFFLVPGVLLILIGARSYYEASMFIEKNHLGGDSGMALLDGILKIMGGLGLCVIAALVALATAFFGKRKS